jgi:ABC-type transport system involved in multi-copper enzyme maturation permease subunit
LSSLSVATPPAWTGKLRVTQLRVVHSEWTKLYSLRSTRWSMFTAVLLTVGFSSLFAVITSSRWGNMRPSERADRHPLDIALRPLLFAQLAIGVLGVLVMTGEYSTGMIRSTITAVPRRLPVLWAKVAVFAAATFALMLPAVLAAFFASQAILSRHDILQISFSAPGVARAVIGGALYLTVAGVFALALGAMTRNTAAGISSFVAVFFVIPPILDILPSSWNNAISPYLPNNAGGDVFALHPSSGNLSPWGGFALFVGYTALALAIAAVLLGRRDT